jgi:2-oxoglutarate/2-oxoacid ferredoxin oxidoreductase subunit alpha
MQRLAKKFETAKGIVPRPVRRDAEQTARFGVIYFRLDQPGDGRSKRNAGGGRNFARSLCGCERFRFIRTSRNSYRRHDHVFVIEQNRDAQLRMLLVNEIGLDPARLIPVLHFDGTPITARFIARAIGDHLESRKVVPLHKVVS